MIQLILGQPIQHESCIAPCENLDSAQILLLQWGNTMSWCWETWNDCRVANTECITQLVGCVSPLFGNSTDRISDGDLAVPSGSTG